MTDKPQKDYILEDWVAYWSPSETNKTCQCHGPNYKCAPCVIAELDASWRKTMEVERASYLALNRRYATLQQQVSDAAKRDSPKHP